jgi:release factor glutamine methyltransferase
MLLTECYQNSLQQLLQAYEKPEAEAILNWVFEDALLIKKHQLSMLNRELSTGEMQQMTGIISRLLNHEPLQYILGYAPFLNFRLKVTPAVLIPRPETEELAQDAIRLLQSMNISNPAVLDVGTGSGCLAIAIKKALPHAQVTAIDVSAEALQVARDNALHLRADIDFGQLDFLQQQNLLSGYRFHLIVSNPPYVRLSEAALMEKHVLEFEPHTALFVPDDDALIFYRHLALFGKTHLYPAGYVVAELNHYLATATQQLFLQSDYSQCEVLKDTSGHERILIARL